MLLEEVRRSLQLHSRQNFVKMDWRGGSVGEGVLENVYGCRI